MLHEERQRIALNPGQISIATPGRAWQRSGKRPGSPPSLRGAIPAWRHLDPLPVLRRDDDKEEESHVNDDKNRKDDEHRARWVLDERAAGAQ